SRVWLQYPGEDPTLDFAFGWQSPMAIRWAALMAFAKSADVLDPHESNTSARDSHIASEYVKFLAITHRNLADEYAKLTGAAVTPLYSSSDTRDNEYSPGNRAVIVSVVEEVAVVREDVLTWEQVIEFRRDARAQSAYRRFVHWLDGEMVNRPAEYVVDEVHRRMEDYTWALRKHGLQVIVGALQRTLDAKTLIGGATTALALESLRLPVISLLAGGGVALGSAAL